MALTKVSRGLLSTGIVDNSTTTAITIDSSENVLVGKTALEYENTAGHIFRNDGFQSSIRSGGNVADFNRLSSHGEIIRLSKDGATVGSISTLDGNSIYIGNGDVNLRMIDVTNDIRPVTSAGTNRDAAVDLGDANARFKDLYLSGGAYLGGTAAANKLDDYEEGTWTPTFSVTSGAVSIFSARYTKIGRQVIINLTFQVTSAISAGNGTLIFTAPFTQFTNGTADVGICSVYPDGDNNNIGLTLNNSSGNNTEFAMVFTLNASYGNGNFIISKLVYETNQ